MYKVNKTTFGILVLSTIILSACTWPWQIGTQPQSDSAMMKEGEELAQALQSGKPMRCTVTSTEGETVEYTVKGEKMRASGTDFAEGEKTGHIIKNETEIYVWEEGATEGFMYTLPSEEEMQNAENATQQPQYDAPDFNDESSVQEYEDRGYTVDCNETNIPDDTFTPPSSVMFKDVNAMMQDAFSQMENESGEYQIPPEYEAMMQKQN